MENYRYTGNFHFAIDPASTELFKDGMYDLGFKDANANAEYSKLPGKGLADLYKHLIKTYRVTLLEDPFTEDD